MEDLIHETYTVGPSFKQASNFLRLLKARFRLDWAMVLVSAAPDAAPKASSTNPFMQKVTIAGMKVYGQSQALTSKPAAKLGLV
jgi:hypothetical protein